MTEICLGLILWSTLIILTALTVLSLLGKIKISIVPMIISGIIIRLILILLFVNLTHYDVNSYKIVGDATANGYNIYPEEALKYHPYLPFMLYIEGLSIILSRWGIPYMFSMKIFFSFFDVINIYLIYLLSNKNNKIAFLYAINPTFLFLSAVHGQIDGIPITFVLAAIYFLQKKREAICGLLFGIGVMVKSWPLMFFLLFIKYVKNKLLFVVLAAIFPVLCAFLYTLFYHAHISDILSTALSYRGSYGAWGSGIVLGSLFQFPEKTKLLLTGMISTDTIITLMILFLLFSLKDIKKELFLFLLIFSIVSIRGANPIWLLPFILLCKPKLWSVWMVACGIYMGLNILVEVLDPLHIPFNIFLTNISGYSYLVLWGIQCIMLCSYGVDFLVRFVNMTSKPATVDYILDQLSAAGVVRARKMFGDYAVYCNEKVVGLICEDQLFIKYTDPGKIFAEGRYTEGYAYPGAKPSMNVSDLIDDRDFLCELIQITVAALPQPKTKK